MPLSSITAIPAASDESSDEEEEEEVPAVVTPTQRKKSQKSRLSPPRIAAHQTRCRKAQGVVSREAPQFQPCLGSSEGMRTWRGRGIAGMPVGSTLLASRGAGFIRWTSASERKVVAVGSLGLA